MMQEPGKQPGKRQYTHQATGGENTQVHHIQLFNRANNVGVHPHQQQNKATGNARQYHGANGDAARQKQINRV